MGREERGRFRLHLLECRADAGLQRTARFLARCPLLGHEHRRLCASDDLPMRRARRGLSHGHLLGSAKTGSVGGAFGVLGHVAFELPLDAMGMGEDLEAVFPRDRDQRHAARISHAHGERRRRGHGGDNGRADSGGFLDHLHRDAARQHDEPLFGRRAIFGQRAGQLVERIVTADVFAHGNQVSLRVPEARGMYGAGLAIEVLPGKERIDRRHDLVRRQHASLADLWRRAHGLDQALDAAKAAARGAGHLAPAPQTLGGVFRLEPDAKLDAHLLFHHLDRVDRVEGGDNTFGQSKADGKVLEVLRRRHHHRIGRGVEGEGDRGLFWNRALAFGHACGAPDGTGNTVDGWRHRACSVYGASTPGTENHLLNRSSGRALPPGFPARKLAKNKGKRGPTVFLQQKRYNWGLDRTRVAGRVAAHSPALQNSGGTKGGLSKWLQPWRIKTNRVSGGYSCSKGSRRSSSAYCLLRTLQRPWSCSLFSSGSTGCSLVCSNWCASLSTAPCLGTGRC